MPATILWEGELEKKGRGEGLSFFYRPWTTRKFVLRSNQILDYYAEQSWRGNFSLTKAVIEAQSPVDEVRRFPFVIKTASEGCIYLNAASEAIRTHCIDLFSRAAQGITEAPTPPQQPQSTTPPALSHSVPSVPSVPLKPKSEETSSSVNLSGPCQVRQEVLSGGFFHPRFPLPSWKRESGRLITFVSSTFTDTHRERDYLMKKLLPELTQVGVRFGLQVNIVDMRWGISDENTADHLTWLSCEEEIVRCFEQSMGMFFLSLQSQKYGYCPIPKFIPAAVLSQFFSKLSDEDRQLFNEWYRLDQNSLPDGRFALKPLTPDASEIFWKTVRPRLATLLEGYSFDQDLVIGHSVTEYEFLRAKKLCHENPQRMAWFSRELPGISSDKHSSKFYEYDDCLSNPSQGEKLHRLREMMQEAFDRALDGQPTKQHFCEATFDEYLDQTEVWQRQFQQWCTEIKHLFFRDVSQVVEVMKKWREDGGGLGVPGELAYEWLHHCEWAASKCATFFGREDLLENAYLLYERMKLPEARAGQSCGIAMALVGQSGSGKTALMAKIGAMIYKRERYEPSSAKEALPVIVRFGGVSASSERVLTLILNLCHQIHFMAGLPYNHRNINNWFFDPRDRNVTTEERKLRFQMLLEYWRTLLNSHPHVLVLDSLDQILDESPEVNRAAMLQAIPVNCKSIVAISTLPSSMGKISVEDSLRRWKVPIFSIPGRFAEPIELLTKGLTDQQRKLTPFQWTVVQKALSVDSSVLYLQLCQRVVAKWTSFQTAEETILQPGVAPIIHQIFDKLEHLYGQVFARAAFSFITLSPQAGVITENDLIELLSMDPNVIRAISQYNRTDRLPYHVWLRLKGEVKDFLVETDQGSLRWYHRQLQETLERRYAMDKAGSQRLIGQYFAPLLLDVDDLFCRGAILPPSGPAMIFDPQSDSSPLPQRSLSLIGTPEGKQQSPHYYEEILTRQFLAIIQLAEQRLNHKIRNCFVVIPAFLNLFQRAAVLEAVELTGLEIIRMEYKVSILPCLDFDESTKSSSFFGDFLICAHFQESCLDLLLVVSDEGVHEVLDILSFPKCSGSEVTGLLWALIREKIRVERDRRLSEAIEDSSLLSELVAARDRLFALLEIPTSSSAASVTVSLSGGDEVSITATEWVQWLTSRHFYHELSLALQTLRARHDYWIRGGTYNNFKLQHVNLSGIGLARDPTILNLVRSQFPFGPTKPLLKDHDLCEAALRSGVQYANSLTPQTDLLKKFLPDDFLVLQASVFAVGIAVEGISDKKSDDDILTGFVSDTAGETPEKSHLLTPFKTKTTLTRPFKKSVFLSIHRDHQKDFFLRFYEKTTGNSSEVVGKNLLLKQLKLSRLPVSARGQPSLEVVFDMGNSLDTPMKVQIFSLVRNSNSGAADSPANRQFVTSFALSKSRHCNPSEKEISDLKIHLSQSKTLKPRDH